MQFHIDVNFVDVVEEEEQAYDSGVRIAAMIEALAELVQSPF